MECAYVAGICRNAFRRRTVALIHVSLIHLISLSFPPLIYLLCLFLRHGPSYNMRRVALAALLAVAASSVSAADEPKPTFKARYT